MRSEKYDNGQAVKRCGLYDIRGQTCLALHQFHSLDLLVLSFSDNTIDWQDCGSQDTPKQPSTQVQRYLKGNGKHTQSDTFTTAGCEHNRSNTIRVRGEVTVIIRLCCYPTGWTDSMTVSFTYPPPQFSQNWLGDDSEKTALSHSLFLHW